MALPLHDALRMPIGTPPSSRPMMAWSIAASNNLTTRTVAAYNGLSEDAQVVLGSTINVPTMPASLCPGMLQ